MLNTPKANRKHLALLGRRNTGKSLFLNTFLQQSASIVSFVKGTTTDPLEKTYELQPFGPVVLIDTAGFDDLGELGQKRVAKTKLIIDQIDLALFFFEPKKSINKKELAMITLLKENQKKIVFIINKIDLVAKKEVVNLINYFKNKLASDFVFTSSALKNQGFQQIKSIIANILSKQEQEKPILSDLLQTPEFAVLVVPIDKEAPKGRLILPQAQTIRELLDIDSFSIVVKERELFYVLNYILQKKPKLVITDSQAFLKVSADVPKDIWLTSFSILFARQKGDLDIYTKGLSAIKNLKDNDKILIAELCSHRPISEDIGRVKIPRWLKQYSGAKLDFEISAGKDFPKDLTKYKLIIQCGGCNANRPYILNRIKQANDQGVAITNYGVIIAFLHGIIERALRPFASSYELYKKSVLK